MELSNHEITSLKPEIRGEEYLRRIEEAIAYQFGESWTPEVRDRRGEHQVKSNFREDDQPLVMVTLDKSKWNKPEGLGKIESAFGLAPEKTRDINIFGLIEEIKEEKYIQEKYFIDMIEEIWKGKSRIVIKRGSYKKDPTSDQPEGISRKIDPFETPPFIKKIVEIANSIDNNQSSLPHAQT